MCRRMTKGSRADVKTRSLGLQKATFRDVKGRVLQYNTIPFAT